MFDETDSGSTGENRAFGRGQHPNSKSQLTQFKPGNPGGRNGGRYKGLAARLREAAGEGKDIAEELATVAVGILRDDRAKTSDRLAALMWVSDRVYGKAPLVVESDGDRKHDFSSYSDAELKRLILSEIGITSPDQLGDLAALLAGDDGAALDG